MTPTRRLTRSLTIPATAFFTAVAILLTYPGGISAAYTDLCCFDEDSHQMEDDQVTGVDLSVRTHAIAERIALKESLVTELIEGRTTLAAVAERFHKLNRDVPACMSAVRMKYPEMSDDERMTMNVLDFVKVRDLTPTQLDAVLGRLNTEYEQMYGHGSLSLN